MEKWKIPSLPRLLAFSDLNDFRQGVTSAHSGDFDTLSADGQDSPGTVNNGYQADDTLPADGQDSPGTVNNGYQADDTLPADGQDSPGTVNNGYQADDGKM
ncbi:hypothetical protein RRG08_000803 [Elysia crispata]|uniref:Uncharacterized protein n=1 Tax=Elysia crispata TaxID=231223 RepID=A0AAE1B7S4_9GAST|nr:hypothetical protein RRG08_000803 [Elysia crispata]